VHVALEPISAVLFDFGHTLFDTASSVAMIVQESASLGHPIGADEASALWTAARDRSHTVEEMAKGRDLGPEQHRACWLSLWSELERRVPGISDALYSYETTAAGWQLYPDVRGVLELLVERGVAMAVVSDTGWDLRPLFEVHDVGHFFTTFVMSYQHGVTKPSPILFRTACERLGVRPSQALMVGDNFRNDGGASDAGCRTLLLPLVPSGSERGLGAVLALVDGR
jgi:HAD superfamily hydrolase (TIGR01509 family)